MEEARKIILYRYYSARASGAHHFLHDLRSDLKTFKSKRDVVDGQQRIRTILSFIDPTLLSDFNPERDEFSISRVHNEDFGGKSFVEFSPEHKQQILDYQFSVHSFLADTDDREILQIFARMNSTGVKLNSQELRNAGFFSLFKTTAYELALEQLYRWQEWKVFTPDQIARMDEVELSSEFMIFMMIGISGRPKGTIDSFYKSHDEKFEDASEVARRFRLVFDAIETHFSTQTLREFFSTRTLFYALFGAFYDFLFGLPAPLGKKAKPPRLSREKPRPFPHGIAEQFVRAGRAIRDKSAPDEVLKALRGATTDTGPRRILIGDLADKKDESPATPEGQISSKPTKD